MHTLPSLNLSARDHLDLIRRLDREHSWSSLSDQRYCMECHEVFSAGEVEIVGGTRALGPLRLQCPTPRCTASPDHWLPVGDRRPTSSSLRGRGVVGTQFDRVRTALRARRSPRFVAQSKPEASRVQALVSGWRKLASRLKMLPVPLQCGGIPADQVS
ncbi:MAG TPA: hypothetical protein VF683_03035 [Chthoniobacterales bacterium]